MYVPLGLTAPAHVVCAGTPTDCKFSCILASSVFVCTQTRAQTHQGPHRHPRRRVSWKYEQRKVKQARQALNQPHLVLWNCTGGTE